MDKKMHEINAKQTKLDDASLDKVTGGINPFTPDEPEGKGKDNPFVLPNQNNLSILAGIVSPNPAPPYEYEPSPTTYTYPIEINTDPLEIE